MWTCQEVFLEVELGSLSWEGLAEQRERALNGGVQSKGWRVSGRESRWSTGCGKPQKT